MMEPAAMYADAIEPETSTWFSGRLAADEDRCHYEYFGNKFCDAGQIQVYVDCDGLNCPNDLPAKCEHPCPNV